MTESEFFDWFAEYLARAMDDSGRRIAKLIREGDNLCELFDHEGKPVPAPISPVASYIDGLLVVLDGWELEDLTLPALEALAATARTWDQAYLLALAERIAQAAGASGGPPRSPFKTVRTARSAWVQRIRVQLGLAPTTTATESGALV